MPDSITDQKITIASDEYRKLRNFYDSQYYAQAKRLPVPRHLHVLAQRLVFRKGVKLLDVACGTGEWLKAAVENGAKVTGIDISLRALTVASGQLQDGLLVAGLGEKLPFADNSFRLLTCLGSLEHFPDKPLALQEMKRVMTDDGELIILVPNAGFLTRRLGLYGGTHQISIREDVYSLRQWQSLFTDAGLQVKSRWRDLHVMNKRWLLQRGWVWAAPRLIQALALALWPLEWQYQVYFHLKINAD
jgi:SAM-dependent methyltransferase